MLTGRCSYCFAFERRWRDVSAIGALSLGAIHDKSDSRIEKSVGIELVFGMEEGKSNHSEVPEEGQGSHK